MKITAVQQIDYDRNTDLIEPTSRVFRAKGGSKGDNLVIAEIARTGYEVVSREVVGWGAHNAIIHVDPMTSERVGGFYLATIADERSPK